MALSEYQVDWINRIKASPVTDEVMDKAKKTVVARETYLKDVLKTVVDAKRQVLDDAQKDLTITNTIDYEGKARKWRKMTRRALTKEVTLPWRAGDEGRTSAPTRPDTAVRADLEVDTEEDIIFRKGAEGEEDKGTHAIADADLDKLEDAYAALNELQAHMAAQIDEEGNRLFSDDDIRRELWTPMVREGLVPDNMVPSKFSEEAAAFSGAVQMYGEKLKDFTKKSTGREETLRNLGIAADVFNLATAGASAIATAVNANTISSLQTELLNPATTADRAKEITKEIAMAQAPALTAAAAGAVISGGLGIASTWIANEAKRSTDDQWLAKAGDATAGILIDMVAKSVSAGIAFGGAGVKGTAQIASGSVQGTLNTLRIGFVIAELALEPSEEKRKQLLGTLGQRIGDAVGNGLTIYSGNILRLAESLPGPDKDAAKAHAAEINQIASLTTAAIKSASNGPVVYEMIRNGRYKEAALMLGGAVVQGALSGASEVILDGLREDVSKQEMFDRSPQGRLYAEGENKAPDTAHKTITDKDPQTGIETQRLETDQERDTRVVNETISNTAKYEMRQTQGSADAVAALEKAMGPLTKAATANLKKETKVVLDQSVLDKMALEIGQQAVAAKQEAVKKELKDHFTEKAVDDMFAEFGTKMKGYETLYADANPVTDLAGTPPDEVEKAMEAISRAMQRSAELRAKVDLINGVTSATAGVIAAIIPGAGAVASAQKVAFDIYSLIQHVDAHNRWVKSMEVAFRGNSAYSAAIEKTLQNAEITMSHKAVTLVLDSIGLGAQVGRCFDPTGATTATAAIVSLTQALVDFGYKMHKESEVASGWALYKDAIDNPGNRKRARKALRGNSTLAKCAIAYGACVIGDPTAKEAVRRGGLSPEILANDKDVCKQLIAWMEQELSDDPVVLQVDKKARDWMPDERPCLTPVSFLQFKQAAARSATPRLSRDSLKTPAIDGLLADLAKHWKGADSYVAASAPLVGGDLTALKDFAEESERILKQLGTALTAYMPMQDAVQGTGTLHKEMGDIVKTLTQIAKLNEADAKRSLDATVKAIAAAPVLPPLVGANP